MLSGNLSLELQALLSLKLFHPIRTNTEVIEFIKILLHLRIM